MRTELQTIRKAAGYKSAKAFAEYMGMSVRTYTNYEQGVRPMSVETAWRFADALGCTLDELAGRDFHREPVALDASERALLGDFRTMDARRRNRLMEDARDYAALSGKARAKAAALGLRVLR